jgi:hypothetical protein
LPGIAANPVPPERGYFGREIREVFGELIAEAGFVSFLPKPTWAAQIAPYHRLAFATTDPVAPGDVAAQSVQTLEMLSRLLDLLSLTHGGAPRALASVVETSDDGNLWRPLAVVAGGGARPTTALDRRSIIGTPATALNLAVAWQAGGSDPRIALWLALFRNIPAERRWDLRVLRCCSLLETIGREVVPPSTKVLDGAGAALRGYDGEEGTAATARGLTYILVKEAIEALAMSDDALRCHPSRNLWSEVGIWIDIRNAVAHEGHAQLEPADALTSRQRRIVEALATAARGASLDAARSDYADAAMAGTEAVLRAAVLGRVS